MVKPVIFLNYHLPGGPAACSTPGATEEAAGSRMAERASAVKPTEGGKVISFLCNLFQLQ